MTRIAYINGAYVPLNHAVVPMEDRAHQFSDGIYEYLAFYGKTPVHAELHLKRLERSLKELRIPMPMNPRALLGVMHELIARNTYDNGGLYLQVSRGVARREHAFPTHVLKPTVSMSVAPSKLPKSSEYTKGVAVISRPDIRWGRRDIKTVSLLGNILAKQAASEAKVKEAWLVGTDGMVTEGSTSNAFIVDRAGKIITHPANERILSGVSREVAIALARKAGMKVEERPFGLDEAKKASEAFMTSTSAKVLPIVSLDGKPIGSGKPGPVTQKLLKLYAAYLAKSVGHEVIAL
uniref:D-alanine aminotransferase-like protein n=1 Tax=uncultured bacterium CSL1 TaxID=1091565 RepID=G4WVA0_9BACT|nr:D-alanine aminotransferase-like protein [uncultured bacterium CSL1]